MVTRNCSVTFGTDPKSPGDSVLSSWKGQRCAHFQSKLIVSGLRELEGPIISTQQSLPCIKDFIPQMYSFADAGGMAAPLLQFPPRQTRKFPSGQHSHSESCIHTRSYTLYKKRRPYLKVQGRGNSAFLAASAARCGTRSKVAMHAVQLGDLAAAHQTESKINPPAALLCVPTTANSLEGALQVQ